MDKKSICSFFYAMMLAILLISCNDEDDYDGLAPAELNGTYSNKLSAPANEDSLILSYNGNTFIGKEVEFKTDDGKTAHIILKYVLPHDKETAISGVSLTAGSGSYSFSGDETTSTGTAFHYQGSIQAGKLILELSDITIPKNRLAMNGTFKTQTSVTNEAPALASTTDPLVRDIYKVGLNTLKECMQTVYEDGPKRDRRLWIGDLYLEALANAHTFKNHELTKHCLYLLAAFANDEGLLHATLLEKPQPHPQYGTHTLDYCLIYNVALLEYLKETGDRETANDLWPVVVRQIELALRQFSPEWIYDMDKKPQYWLVFDWKDGYDRQASMQGLTIFALQHSYELAKMLGKEKEAGEWPTIAGKMKKAARQHFYDKKRGVMVSGKDKQISYLSQVWMILSNTLDKKEGAKAMATVMSMPDACYPGCPYAYHYVIEALLQCGMPQEARKLITDYWGSMVKRGADTFWEVYDPNNDYLSPYGFFVINSYCHAWSCTPIYFINKYPEIFQK